MPDHGKVIWWRDSGCNHMNPHGNPIHVSFSGLASAGFPTVDVRHALPMTCPLSIVRTEAQANEVRVAYYSLAAAKVQFVPFGTHPCGIFTCEKSR